MIEDDRLDPVVPGLFDFSILFEQSILSLLPAALFIFLSPLRIYLLLKRQTETRSQALLVAKEIVIFVYLVFQASLLGLWCQPSTARTKVSIAEGILGVLEAITIAIYSYAQHVKSVKQSWLLNGYLMLSLLFDAVQVRTYWLRPDLKVIASVFSATFAFKAVLVVLEELPKKLIDWEKTSARETRAGIVSRSIFWWINRFLLVGFRTVIDVGHIGPIDQEMDSRKLLSKLQEKWDKAPKTGKHVLVRCAFSAYKSQFFMGVIPRLCFSSFTLAQPFLQKQIIRHVGITDKKSISEEIGGLVGATALVYVGLAITGALYKHATFRLLTMFRGSIVSMVYQKTLRLDAASVREAAPVSLMSTDVERAVMSADKIHDLWASFLELPVVMYILARQVGAPAVFIVVPSLITTGGTLLLAPMFAPAQFKWNAAIQKRVGETSSMLSQIKACKMMGLVDFFGTRLQHLRKSELELARPFRILQTATTFLDTFTVTATPSTVILAAIFWTKAEQGLSTVEAFTALTTIAIATSPLATFLAASKYLSSSLGSFSRIEEFLLSDTYEDCRQIKACPEDATLLAARPSPDLQSGPKQMQTFDDSVELNELGSSFPDQASETIIKVENASFRANKDTTVLHNISMEVESGTLSMIVGRVGCGKSSLLRAMAGEIAKQSGNIEISVSSMAYCSQKPWLKNVSVRDNILGQSAYDEAWFATVTKACALNEDIEAFPQKEHTLVGTGGVSLSGGQQQRVALARAVYSRKRLAVIDDAFSGLDNTTARFVFQALFGSEGLLRRGNHTVVLVTNNVNFLSSADCITMLDNGRITRNQVSYSSFEPSAWGVLQKDTQDSSSNQGSESEDETRKQTVAASAALIEEQNSLSRALGDWECYKIYVKSIGIKFFISFLVFNAVLTVLEYAPRLYIKYWTEVGTNTGSRFTWLGGYITIDIARMLLDLLVTVMFFMWAMPISAQKLHSMLLKSVLRAPLYFFTSTDSGNTLNRFSQDMSLVDQALPLAFFITLICVMEVAVTIALIVSGASYSAISVPFAILTLYLVQKYYLRTSRQIRLLDLELKTPLYTQFSETLAGLSTIRAFGWSDDLLVDNYRLLDTSQRPFYTLFCIQRWLNVVLDLFAAGMAVLLVSIALFVPSSTSQGAVGVSLVTLIQFNVTLSLMIRYWTDLETSLGAIARLKWFVEKTSDENREGESESVSSDWPPRGEIELENVTAAYSDGLDPVLQDITLKIQAGQKVGICGRSGSGKSSLIATILRLLEVTPKSTLTIDNANLTRLPRQTIRSHITALPQDPFHISGTVRFNLDPEGAVQADSPLINALQMTSIWSIIEGRGGLDAEMDDLGFSVGQMQLFCLARVLLRRSKVVLLDEATSSVDRATDDEVREAIKADLEGRTVVEVAHRVEIVKKYDVVVTMAEGRIVEIGSPDELLEKPQGLFRALWESK